MGTVSGSKAILVWVALLMCAPVYADRAQLLQHYQQMRQQSAPNPYDEPLFIRSDERGERLGADIYAVLPQSYAEVRAALAQADQWCRFLVLNQNVKACTWRPGARGEELSLFVGRKFYQEPQDAFQVVGRFEVMNAGDRFLRVSVNAGEGPFGTENYHISVQATPLEQGTLVHLGWGYEDSWRSRMATSTYLATLGRDKVGFSVVGKGPGGQPQFVQGVRGIIERNAMRYYLALRAYLQTDDLPEARRPEASMVSWFRMVERYPRQLHELSREEYLDNKRREWRNQRRLQRHIAAEAQAQATPAY